MNTVNLEGLPLEYKSDYETWVASKPEKEFEVGVFGDSDTGKTYEIERARLGNGQRVGTSTTQVVSATAKKTPPVKLPANVPFNDYAGVPVLINDGGVLKQACLKIHDLAGQYNKLLWTIPAKPKFEITDSTEFMEKELANWKIACAKQRESFINVSTNLNGSDKREVHELVADITRPETLDSLLNNWMPMLESYVTKSDKQPEVSIYLSHLMLAKPEVVKTVTDEPKKLLNLYPNLGRLISKIESVYHVSPMLFAGDMNCTREGKENQSVVYMLKSNDWLDSSLEVSLNAPKVLPLMKYLSADKKLVKKETKTDQALVEKLLKEGCDGLQADHKATTRTVKEYTVKYASAGMQVLNEELSSAYSFQW